MKFALTFLLVWGVQAKADILEDFDSLGSNKVLLEKAQALAPDKKIEIVQNRIVNRVWRQEMSNDFEVIGSGANPYFHTQTLGLAYQVHINPHWSMGLKYNYAFNQLSAEGDKIIADGRAKQEDILKNDPNSTEKPEPFIPEMNWMKQSYLALINWYPIYGKFKFLNSGIVHFDFYTHLAVGQAELRYNDSTIYQAGLGMGLWWSQHLTSRLEYKFSSYQADFYEKQETINTANWSLSVGYLL